MRIIHVDSYSPTGFLAKHIKEVDKFPERIDHYWGFRVLSRIKKNYPNTECIFIRPGVDREPVTAKIKGVKVIATSKALIRKDLGSFTDFCPSLISTVKKFSEGDETIIHIHDYSLVNTVSLAFILRNKKVMLQHIGPPHSIPRIKELIKEKKGSSFLKIMGYYTLVFLLERMLPRSSHYLTLGESERQYMIRYHNILKDNIHHQPYGIEFNDIKPLSEQKKKIVKDKLGIGENKRIATFVGPIQPQHRGADLLPAINNQVKKEINDFQIIAIGRVRDTELASKLKKDGIMISGFIPLKDTLDIVGSSDLFIWPCYKMVDEGGIGMATVEAMALNIPVVTSTLKHMPVSYHKEVGIYTENIGEKVNVKKFSNSIKHVLNNKNEYSNVRNTALEFYDWNRIINKTMEHYKKMQSNKKEQ